MNPEQLVLRKYAGLDHLGRRAALQGEMLTFPGFSEAIRNRLNVSMLFDEPSRDLVKRRVSRPLETVEEESGVTLLLAGLDYPTHSTVLESVYPGNDDDERKKVYGEISGSEEMSSVAELLAGATIEYNYLLMDNRGSLILTAGCIPEEILEAREQLSTLYQRFSLQPLPMENILHISAGRIISLPEDDDQRTAALKKYEDGIVKMRRYDISPHPLRLQVGQIYRGRAGDLISMTP